MILKNLGRYPREILTRHGVIHFVRTILKPANRDSARLLMEKYGVKSIAPLDEALDIEGLPFKVTRGMMLEIARRAISSRSYEDARMSFLKGDGIDISSDQIKKVTDYVGDLVFRDDCMRAEEAKELYAGKLQDRRRRRRRENDILYVETDGAMVNTRKVKDGSSWRENKLAIAFSSKDIEYWETKTGHSAHKILERDYVSLIGSVEDFKYHLLALAARNECYIATDFVIISDGAKWIKGIRDEFFPNAVHILDLCHLKENVGKFAMYKYNNAPEYHAWADEICDMLEEGKWKKVLKIIEEYKDKKTPAGVVNLYTYIYNNRDSIDYPSYRERGYFVGSGAIESSNKTVMQERLKLSGMRWNVDSAQGIVSLRARSESGHWNEVEELVKSI